MESLLRDLRFALRIYAKHKSFSIVAVLALAIGIGANIAIFTVVNALLLRPLPYPDSERLVQIGRSFRESPSYTMSYSRYRYLERNSHMLASLAAYDVVGSSLSALIGTSPQLLQSNRVTANFFQVLEIHPYLGRDFTPEDGQPGAAPVALISYGAWREVFAKDNDIVGRPVRLSGESYRIIGVMPAGFGFTPDAEIWAPIRKSDDWTERSNAHLTIGRLRPGVSREAAQQDINALIERLRVEQPATTPSEELGALVTSYHERIIGDTWTPLLVLTAAAACVLLIACVNVANLLFARAIGRRKEISIRIALGINRARLIRQLLTESILLATISSAIGLLIAALAVRLLKAWSPPELPRVNELSVDPWVLLFTIGASLLTGVVFGLVPALQLARMNSAETLKESARATTGRGIRRLQGGLVSLEIALSTVLLVAAGLLLISFEKLQNVDLGYRPEGVLTFKTSLAAPEFQATEPVMIRVRRALDRVKSIPGVNHAAAVSRLPTEANLVFPVEALSGGIKSDDETGTSVWKAITPEFFDVISIALRSGRAFTDSDTLGSAPVAVINEAFVRQYFEETSPIGQQIIIGRQMGENFADKPREIVGVVGNTIDKDVQDGPSPTVFIPTAQTPDRTMAFLNHLVPLSWVVQVMGDTSVVSSQVRKEIFAATSDLIASDPRPLAQMLSQSIARQRMQTTMVSLFAGIALFLGALGLYGVLAHSVAERRHEIGIRLALGASSKQVLWLMIGYSLKLLVPGLIVGVALSLLSRRVLVAFLFGVTPTNITVYCVVLALLSMIALVATIGPALRAARVDPILVLRQ